MLTFRGTLVERVGARKSARTTTKRRIGLSFIEGIFSYFRNSLIINNLGIEHPLTPPFPNLI